VQKTAGPCHTFNLYVLYDMRGLVVDDAFITKDVSLFVVISHCQQFGYHAYE